MRVLHLAFGLKVALVLAFASPARAQLQGDFADRLMVDTEYVTGANNATDIAFAGDGRAVVTRKNGQITIRRTNGTVVVVDNPFPGSVDTGSEKGLLGVVSDPQQDDAFFFYVSNGDTAADKHRVYHAVLTDDDMIMVDMMPIVGASRMLGPGLEGPANHDGGGLSIHDNKLYVGVGDTGSNSSPPSNKYGSCLNKGNGKVLRVNLDGTIPSDNPLLGVSSVTTCTTTRGDWETGEPDQRVFIWGFRNPFRVWVDPKTGLAWIGDVGEETREEISVLSSGQHAGYPFVEGTHDWGDVGGMNCTSLTPSRPCTAPVYDYPRTQGAAVTGGLIPEGCGWSNVFSSPHYVFGDSGEDFIRALPVNNDRTGVSSTMPVDVANYDNQGPVAFRMGRDESLYVVMYGAGTVYRFTPTDRSGADCLPSGSGGSGGAGMGGNGTTGSGGTGVDPGATAGDDGGCGCRTTGTPAGSSAWLFLLAGVAGVYRRRWRRT